MSCRTAVSSSSAPSSCSPIISCAFNLSMALVCKTLFAMLLYSLYSFLAVSISLPISPTSFAAILHSLSKDGVLRLIVDEELLL